MSYEIDVSKRIASLYYLIVLLNQGNDMDASRGIMSGTMDRFKMVSKLDL